MEGVLTGQLLVAGVFATLAGARLPGSRVGVQESFEAVEDELERELELLLVVAAPQSASVSHREGHFGDVGEGGVEFAGEAGGRLWVELSGVVEQLLGEPER